MELILEALRARVDDAPHTKAFIAAALHVCPSSLWRMLHGKTAMSLHQFIAICYMCGIKPSDLLEEAGY